MADHAMDDGARLSAIKIPFFSGLASSRASAIAAVGALAVAATLFGPSWGDKAVGEMAGWQAQGVSERLFTGSAALEASRFDLRGDHAMINAGDKPAIVAELGMSVVGQLLDPAHFELDKALHRKMTFMHERGHIEYQTAMPERFDAPGLSPSDRVRFSGTFAKSDAGAYIDLRSRLHGAMHERFAEAYGALGLAIEASKDPKEKARVDGFLSRRVAERSFDPLGSAKSDFAHKLGLDVDAALQATRAPGFDKLSPNQIKAVALRIASLSYLADAHSDATLAPLIEGNLQGPASKALWSGVGRLTGAGIAERAMRSLPDPVMEATSAAPIASTKFGANARLTSAQIGVQAAPSAPKPH